MHKLNNIFFAGAPDFAAIILESLVRASMPIKGVLTHPDKPAGRGMKMQMSPVKKCALQHLIPVYQPASLRLPEEQMRLRELAPDLLIVAAYGLILPQAVLDIPTRGCINVHPSLLPRWRGAAPIIRAVLAGDTETGVTLMQMDAGLDTGGIIEMQTCPVYKTDTTHNLHDRLAELGARMLIEYLSKMTHGQQIQSTPQPAAGMTYAAKVSKEEARIDWSKSAEEISRQIRAFNPVPVAYTRFKDIDHIKIWDAMVIDENKSGVPGSILTVTHDGIDVATARGIVRIKRLQFPGAKPVDAKNLVNTPIYLQGVFET